mmetsp:Transcript_2773/g.4881  ORF Transcript_2773/g.4881 Transcript_2773/m.4881 type:complete len:80 (-) Transcript_2773:1105-1344(-)
MSPRNNGVDMVHKPIAFSQVNPPKLRVVHSQTLPFQGEYTIKQGVETIPSLKTRYFYFKHSTETLAINQLIGIIPELMP